MVLLIILNLIIIEALLSVDNAAVLAVMVKGLPKEQQPRALRYGLIGAYVFRGVCLLLAAWLIKIVWLKIVGGLYLLYLVYSHFTPQKDSAEEGFDENKGWVKKLKAKIGPFWGTVILVEIMDLAFSLDNVLAAVALSNNFWVVMLGVAIGILAMRFVAQLFVKLMERYPTLERSAFIVIALLGVKLILGGVVDYVPALAWLKRILEAHSTDAIFSLCMMGIFFIPLLKRKPIFKPQNS